MLVLLLLLITPASLPPQASPQIWAEYHSPSGSHAYVVGYYQDFWNGWSATFHFQNTKGQWNGYYLDHESTRWRDVRIQPVPAEAKLCVRKAGQVVAEYSYDSNLFYDARGKHQYAPQTGIETSKLRSNLVSLFSQHQKLD